MILMNVRLILPTEKERLHLHGDCPALAQRSKISHAGQSSGIIRIIQAGMYEHLRDTSLAGLEDIGFDGVCHWRLVSWVNPRRHDPHYPNPYQRRKISEHKTRY